MRAIETRPVRRMAGVLTSVVLVMGLVATAAAQPLPRVEGPLTMEQAVDFARQSNLRVKAADADARTMDSMRREALGPFWPQLSANGYFADQSLAPNVYTSAGNTMARNYQVFDANRTGDANVTAMYSLFSGGRDYYGYRAAARRADAAREMRRGTELDVAMQARLDYIAALREAENVRVTSDLRRDVEERLRLTREQVEAGQVPRFYVLRDEAERANTLQMDAMARSRAEQALIALKTTLGIDLSSPITLADALVYAPEPIAVEEGARQAVDGHPDIRSAINQRQAAQADVRASYGNYFPQVSLSYMYDGMWSKNRSEASMSADGYSVGVVVTLPLFDGFQRENAVKTAKAKLDRAVHGEGLARQQIEKEVHQTALMLRAAGTSVEASRAGLTQAEEEFRVVKERFESGRGIHLEILDAQVSLTRARFNAVAALAEYNAALAMWLRATGRIR
jgi:outer membrane protein TolC